MLTTKIFCIHVYLGEPCFIRKAKINIHILTETGILCQSATTEKSYATAEPRSSHCSGKTGRRHVNRDHMLTVVSYVYSPQMTLEGFKVKSHLRHTSAFSFMCQMTEKVRRSLSGLRLHNSSHSRRGNIGTTWGTIKGR